MVLPDRCLDCPLAFDDALFLVGVSLALLLFGRVLLSIPRRLLRAFGIVGLGAALVLHAFGLASVALVGVGRDAARTPARDAAFGVAWVALSLATLLLAGRLAGRFPRRAPRLELLSGSGSPDSVGPDTRARRRSTSGDR